MPPNGHQSTNYGKIEGQTVEEYLRIFRKEQDKYDGPIADIALRSSFIKGLKPKIAKSVHAAHPPV